MTIEAAVRAHLGDASIADLVGDRIYPVKLKDDCDKPAMTYFFPTETPTTDLSGSGAEGDLDEARLVVDCWAVSYSGSRDVGRAVRARMRTDAATFSSTLDVMHTLYEPETKLYRTMLEFTLFYTT